MSTVIVTVLRSCLTFENVGLQHSNLSLVLTMYISVVF